MEDKQTENIINERCKILGKLVEKVGNLKYNGAMVQTSEDFYIPASTWELRFDVVIVMMKVLLYLKLLNRLLVKMKPLEKMKGMVISWLSV